MTTTLLDIRRIIAGLLGVYGVILLVAGIVGSSEQKNKAAGVNINLWAGIVLLLMATFFLVWALTRPLMEELEDAEAEGRAPGAGRTGRAALGGSAPGGNSASTAPPNPPPMIRAPSAPASRQASTARSTSGTDTS